MVGLKVGPFRAGVTRRGFGAGVGPFKATGGYGGIGDLVALIVLVGFWVAVAALALALCVVIGFLWGFVLIVRGLQAQRGRRAGSVTGRVVGGIALSIGCGALITAVAVYAITYRSPAAVAAARARTAHGIMPNVVGQHLSAGQDQVDKWEHIANHPRAEQFEVDLSPLDRDPDEWSNWTVARTYPAPGAPVGPRTQIILFCLKNDEYGWFKAHPRMPRLKHVSEADTLSDGDGKDPFPAYFELIQYRENGKDPYGSTDDLLPRHDSYRPIPNDPTRMSKRETLIANHLPDGNEYGLVSGQSPRPGAPMRLGQMITIYTKIDK